MDRTPTVEQVKEVRRNAITEVHRAEHFNDLTMCGHMERIVMVCDSWLDLTAKLEAAEQEKFCETCRFWPKHRDEKVAECLMGVSVRGASVPRLYPAPTFSCRWHEREG